MSSRAISSRCLTGLNSKFCAIIGSQWGDEGKGKLVDILAPNYDYICRFNGGNNAGHTIVANGKKYPFHLVPCGILYPQCKNVLGNGVVINIPSMFEELKQLANSNIDYRGRMIISDRAHIVTNLHMLADSKNEADLKEKMIGTTKKGIGPAYSTKASRIGLRMSDLKNWDNFVNKYNVISKYYSDFFRITTNSVQELEELKHFRDILMSEGMIQDTSLLLYDEMKAGKRILAEGANALHLDLDFGTYPFVTSSITWAGGISPGLGVPPGSTETLIGIVKAYTTRVGEGPFPAELKNEIGASIQKLGFEFGVTTGRPRRCGWLDIPMMRYSQMLNGFTSFNLTKLDILSHLDEIKIVVGYKLNGKELRTIPADLHDFASVEPVYESFNGWKRDIAGITKFSTLPSEAKTYICRVEELLEAPITWIGTGAERESIILNKQGSKAA